MRLTKEQEKEIVRLFEQGNSVLEIKDITGCSVTSQETVLGRVGLDKKIVASKAQKIARHNFNSEMRKKNDNRPEDYWKSAPSDVQELYIQEATEDYLFNAQLEYNALFDIEVPSSTADVSPDTNKYIKVQDILDYCSNAVNAIEICRERIHKLAKEAVNVKIIREFATSDEYFQRELALYAFDIPNIIKNIQNGTPNKYDRLFYPPETEPEY
jgi:hypothetical protein